MRSLRVVSSFIVCLALIPAAASAQSAQDQLWDAAIAGDTVAIRAAVANGAELSGVDDRVSRNGRLALNWAAYYNHVPAVRLLLELGADIEAINYTGFTALHHAAEAGSYEAAVLLLEAGANPNHASLSGALPVETAARLEHPKLVELLSNLPKPDEDG